MRSTPERIGVLLEHGLSEYQARVYLALLEFPALPAGTLAKAAQVPRNRLYEILDELQGMDLVEIFLEETRKYRAKPIGAYVDHRIGAMREHMDRLEAQKRELETSFRPPALGPADELESGATRVVLTRRAVAREIDRIVDETSASLLTAGSLGGWERVLRHLERFDRDGAKLEIYLPREANLASEMVTLAGKRMSHVRWVDAPLRTLTFIRDERELLLVHPMPDDAKMRAGRDFALLTTSPAFVRDQAELLRAASR